MQHHSIMENVVLICHKFLSLFYAGIYELHWLFVLIKIENSLVSVVLWARTQCQGAFAS